MQSDPISETGAAYFAGPGNYVFEIQGVPGWDANALLEGRVRAPDGSFGGNPWRGEGEIAIRAKVPLERIVRWGRVGYSASGKLKVVEWTVNPYFQATY
jgi:hypothetical protein